MSKLSGITYERQRMCLGVHVSLRPSAHCFGYDVSLSVKWYGFIFMSWNYAMENYGFKWYQYPKVVALIAWHTLLFICNKGVSRDSDTVQEDKQ